MIGSASLPIEIAFQFEQRRRSILFWPQVGSVGLAPEEAAVVVSRGTGSKAAVEVDKPDAQVVSASTTACPLSAPNLDSPYYYRVWDIGLRLSCTKSQ